VENEIRQRLQANTRIPPGVNVAFGGQSEMRQKNFAELFKALGTASVLTFLCVAGIIESFVFGTIIILSIPVSLTGVVLAMLIGDVGVSILALMAMIMLVGMVVNSAIVVLDYAIRPEHKHLPPVQRVREACEVRFRVIAMANLTAIVAMVPLSLGMGFAAEIFQPIAIVQIGGILASGTLALLVVPAVYAMIENRRQRMKGRLVPHDAGSPRSA
jgi:HAE1 family hydrophobic/amphiphilic exporter-1